MSITLKFRSTCKISEKKLYSMKKKKNKKGWESKNFSF